MKKLNSKTYEPPVKLSEGVYLLSDEMRVTYSPKYRRMIFWHNVLGGILLLCAALPLVFIVCLLWGIL